jgi:hypothetical protein
MRVLNHALLRPLSNGDVMNKTGRWLATALVAAASTISSTAQAQNIAVGNQNTFSGGTTEGWLINLLGFGGAVPQPQVIPTGGPGGAGDAYLQLTSRGGGGPGSRLVALNLEPTWTGNYLAAGVGALAIDAINLGQSSLTLRLMFENPIGPNAPTDIAASFTGATLAAGSGWQRLLFPLADLRVVAPMMDLTALLSNTTAIRLYHSDAFGPPEPVTAQLGVDNITAVAAVPEPSTFLLVGGGLVAAAAFRRRRRA